MRKLINLLIFTIILIPVSLQLLSNPAWGKGRYLPKCNEVDDLLSQILNQQTKETNIDLTLKNITAVREVKKIEQDKNIRLCYAILQTATYNKLEALYSVSPDGNDFWVQIEEVNPIIDAKTLSKTGDMLNNQMGEDRLQAFEMAKKFGDMKEACLSLSVAKNFFLSAKNEVKYIQTNKLLEEFCKK
ncbi:hypothetical protein [Histophilus somni]|uniref:Uncharacterized protein n=1 Tax=Histophilus somni TaxID=731 RepID=A0AAX2RY16_HISSO|nr:hypothetical protein [Histophilus somni]TDF40554.1 hypothetical protein E1290_05170 [Histophilus somni]TEW28974.1 hypothetical protein E2R48_07805 [Histophilus somni]TFF01099.1 hypothetical protein E3U35_07780 [Histophilus somni]THA91324.1 hypothetical protein E6A58_07690 [Histophilus somni]TJY52668.1 hypothetical protein FAZ28_03705 [Histophilus somni]